MSDRRTRSAVRLPAVHLLVSGFMRGAGFIRFRTSPPIDVLDDPSVPRTVSRNAAAPRGILELEDRLAPVHAQHGPGLSVPIHQLEAARP